MTPSSWPAVGCIIDYNFKTHKLNSGRDQIECIEQKEFSFEQIIFDIHVIYVDQTEK